MGLSQIANYLFPLITIPYITRVVGPSNYGLVEFANVVMLYFVVIVDYSFNTTATRKIAAIGHLPARLSMVFSSVMWARIILFGLGLVIFSLLVFSIPRFRENLYLLWISFPIVLGWALYPHFLFAGTQKLGMIALANVVIKGLATLLIFVFIRDQQDFYYITFISGATQVVVGIITLILAFRLMPGLSWLKLKAKAVKAVIWEGRFVFFSNFFTRIYGFSSLLIGGFLLSPLQLGLFASASKLINVAQSFLFQPLHGALFPFLSQKMAAGTGEFRASHRKSLILLALVSTAATILLIVLSSWVVRILFGEDYREAAQLVAIMAPMLAVGSFGHMHLQQGLLILRQDKSYMYLIMVTGVSSVILNLWLINSYAALGAATVRLITEVMVAVFATVLFYQKLKKS